MARRKLQVKVKLAKVDSGFLWEDIVMIGLTPHLLEVIIDTFEEMALKTDDCYKQELYREVKDLAEEAYREWRRPRWKPENKGG